jgi:uncharacterized protein YpmS
MNCTKKSFILLAALVAAGVMVLGSCASSAKPDTASVDKALNKADKTKLVKSQLIDYANSDVFSLKEATPDWYKVYAKKHDSHAISAQLPNF